MSGLPVEGWIGLGCGVMIVLIAVGWTLFVIASLADEDIAEAEREWRADMLAAEAERFLRASERARR